MNKVAQVTLYFWIMKICATTLGETAGDLLSMTMNIGYAISSIILLSLFLITLVMQLLSCKFHPVLYWSVILTTSTAGTTMSDYMDRTLGLGYAKGSLILITCLLIVLAVWRFSEKTLSVSNIQTTKAELFYWVAILFSNTLGTALGDFLADDSGLGFLGGAILVGGIITLIAAASIFTQLNRVMLFWFAFILTRPFGATFGDLLTKPVEKGGLGFGTVGSSMILAVLLVAFLVYTIIREKRTSPEALA
ncbi:COG4705 family protein [Methylobacter sp.]|uniref:COG4705 family protein n=1 Tax=Methylobacter sp. TaxID=2051955 RepID=UPI002FDD24E3